MRTGISITLKPADRRRLKALARDRNTPHKHVWRAEIVLLSADGVGTNEIMRRTGKSKTCVWRWQERFMEAGYDSLLRDKTPPLAHPAAGVGHHRTRRCLWFVLSQRQLSLYAIRPLADIQYA